MSPDQLRRERERFRRRQRERRDAEARERVERIRRKFHYRPCSHEDSYLPPGDWEVAHRSGRL